MTRLRRLDHVAVAVVDTERALRRFRDELGLPVVHREDLATPPVRLTYLDCGNLYLQLVEPLDSASPLAAHLREQGEGLHHLGFGVDDVPASVRKLAGTEPVLGSGRGRVSAFVPGEVHGVRVEVTEFRPEDLDPVPGRH